MSSALKQEIETRGFAIVENLLDEESISAVVDDYDQLLDRLAPQ